MKKIVCLTAIIIFVSLSCNIGKATQQPSNTSLPPKVSEHRCGDDVCDKPENTQNCPQDCKPGEIVIPDSQSQFESDSNNDNEENTGASNISGEVFGGVVFIKTDLDRQMGEGTCGIEPWKPTNCKDTGPAQWWGTQLSAVITNIVLIIPSSSDTWTITNNTDVVSEYLDNFLDVDITMFNQRDGFYQSARVDPSISLGCTATETGNRFGMNINGEHSKDQTSFTMVADPSETRSGDCNGVSFNYTLHNLLYGMSVALSGDPSDLSAIMSEADYQENEKLYRRTFVVSTNPSPENRDNVTVTMEFFCAKLIKDGANSTDCPWK